jgi:hypothetical protein
MADRDRKRGRSKSGGGYGHGGSVGGFDPEDFEQEGTEGSSGEQSQQQNDQRPSANPEKGPTSAAPNRRGRKAA